MPYWLLVYYMVELCAALWADVFPLGFYGFFFSLSWSWSCLFVDIPFWIFLFIYSLFTIIMLITCGWFHRYHLIIYFVDLDLWFFLLIVGNGCNVIRYLVEFVFWLFYRFYIVCLINSLSFYLSTSWNRLWCLHSLFCSIWICFAFIIVGGDAKPNHRSSNLHHRHTGPSTFIVVIGQYT